MNFFTNRATSGAFKNSPGRTTFHRFILFRSKLFRIFCKRTFQEPVVRFVSANTELGQRIAHGKALDVGDKSPDDCPEACWLQWAICEWLPERS
jgi:hypothetical protein